MDIIKEKNPGWLKVLAWATTKMKIPLTKEKTADIICFGRKNKSLLLDITSLRQRSEWWFSYRKLDVTETNEVLTGI